MKMLIKSTLGDGLWHGMGVRANFFHCVDGITWCYLCRGLIFNLPALLKGSMKQQELDSDMNRQKKNGAFVLPEITLKCLH